jgi:phytanoyl-CoA hydroxylase
LNGFSPDELARFRQDGYVILRGFLARPACDAMKVLAQRHLAGQIQPIEYEAQVRYPGAPASLDAPGGRTVRRLLQACARDPSFREWATCAALAGRLRQLLGPDVALSQAHHNCVMTKDPAYSSLTGWHQDIRYWAFARADLVSAWLALGAEREDNGCLLVVPGSHRLELPRRFYDEALFLRTDLDETKALLASQTRVELDAGDVLFFHARLLHAAGRNRTPETKLSLVFTYHATDNLPLPGTRSASIPDIVLPAY